MWRALVSIMLISGASSMAGAQTVTDPDQIAARLRFWSQGAEAPVYYGEVRNVNARTGQALGHYQCLALAFIKYDGGVFQYAHKMWGKSADGSCHYENVTARKVGNHGACVSDTNAGFGLAIGTTLMTKENIDPAKSIFRTVNTRTRRVGETAACVPPNGAGAGLSSMKIENGRFKIVTTRPLDYEVSIEPQDGHAPPTKPVF